MFSFSPIYVGFFPQSLYYFAASYLHLTQSWQANLVEPRQTYHLGQIESAPPSIDVIGILNKQLKREEYFACDFSKKYLFSVQGALYLTPPWSYPIQIHPLIA